MGASLRALVSREVVDGGNRDDVEKRVEKRLVALLNCHLDELPEHLRHVTGLLKSKEIPINWIQLLSDVQNWQRESRDVQRRWAGQFWRFGSQDKPTGDISQTKNDNKEEE
jgi:CRISPR system Cascade subunit CasB